MSLAGQDEPQGHEQGLALGADAWSVWTTAVKERTGAKGKALFMPLRLILTGQAHGPDMATLTPLIGRARIARRLAGETA